MIAENGNNRYANNILFTLMIAGTSPLLIIFGVYIVNQDTSIISLIYNKTQSIPALTSSFNPVMTKVMDIYCKSAPFIAILIFLFSFKSRETKKIKGRSNLIIACIFSPFVYSLYVCVFLWNNFELTTAGRPLSLMAENNTTLLIFYVFLYIASLLMTYGMCYIPVLAYKLYKVR